MRDGDNKHGPVRLIKPLRAFDSYAKKCVVNEPPIRVKHPAKRQNCGYGRNGPGQKQNDAEPANPALRCDKKTRESQREKHLNVNGYDEECDGVPKRARVGRVVPKCYVSGWVAPKPKAIQHWVKSEEQKYCQIGQRNGDAPALIPRAEASGSSGSWLAGVFYFSNSFIRLISSSAAFSAGQPSMTMRPSALPHRFSA